MSHRGKSSPPAILDARDVRIIDTVEISPRYAIAWSLQTLLPGDVRCPQDLIAADKGRRTGSTCRSTHYHLGEKRKWGRCRSRYALVLKDGAYDVVLDGPISDSAHCLERTDALDAPIYTECPDPQSATAK